jgi:biopolymer transport protein ExbB
MKAMKARKTSLIAIVALLGCALGMVSTGALAQDQAKTLEQLLQMVKDGRYAEGKENKAREAQFRRDKAAQEKMLSQARAERSRLEARSARKEQQFEDNEKKVVSATQRLTDQKGSLNELFGHLTTAAGDMVSVVEVSPVSAQFPGREQFFQQLIQKISGSEKLPTIEEIEHLWFEIQREMTESGNVVLFDAIVVKPNGDEQQQSVVRVGSFNLVSEGNYLSFTGSMLEQLPRQPNGRYLKWAADLAASDGGMNSFGIDPTGPTGGSLLSALIGTPTLEERWHQGGYVGYAITVLGVIAMLIAIWRLLALTTISGKVSSQLKSDKANPSNPLGRVLAIHEANPTMDTETLELKLNEQVLKEIPKLEKYQGALKIIAAVAPLMGLLGTVTGMIITFQAITIYGAGDPKAMASGISSALITTVLGLLVAIPTVLMHTMVAARSKRVVQILEEQTSGIIAEHTEAQLSK